MDVCQAETFKAYFLEFAIISPLVIVLQIALFCYTLYHEFATEHRIRRLLRILYVALQIIALYWNIANFVRYTVVPRFMISTQTKLSCTFLAYSSYLPIVFYTVYIIALLLIIQDLVKKIHSTLKLKAAIFWTASVATLIVSIFTGVTFLIINDEAVCLREWIPPDYHAPNDPALLFCDAPFSKSNIRPLILFSLVYLLCSSSLISIVFVVKLKVLLYDQKKRAAQIEFEVKSLMVKICILTMSGSLLSMLFWIIWALLGDGGATLLFVDAWLHCVIIALLFECNEAYYKRVCRCCILSVFLWCNRSSNKAEETETLHSYLSNYVELSDDPQRGHAMSSSGDYQSQTKEIKIKVVTATKQAAYGQSGDGNLRQHGAVQIAIATEEKHVVNGGDDAVDDEIDAYDAHKKETDGQEIDELKNACVENMIHDDMEIASSGDSETEQQTRS